MPLEPLAYLNEVLDYLQQDSINRDQVDWAALRHDSRALAAGARTTVETYPAITMALDRLDDRHSFFLTPEEAHLLGDGQAKTSGLTIVFPDGIVVTVLPGSPAARAGVGEGDTIELINDQPLAVLGKQEARDALQAPVVTLRLRPARAAQRREVTLHAAVCPLATMPQGRLLEQGIAYLELPEMSGTEHEVTEYAATAQRLIRELDQHGASGWVVDLRRNGGGNMWPMLAGVGPLLGEGKLGVFTYPDREAVWTYRAGRALLGELLLAQVDDPYELRRPGPPVAVLTSRLTSSSGELTLLAFRGRPRTRSFGEPTSGVPTANAERELSDGAMIYLTVAYGTDRVGRTYSGPVVPDQPLPVDWTRFGRRDDPVLHAALEWLLCRPSWP